MTTHELKTWPVFYQEVVAGRKTYEVRNNDRMTIERRTHGEVDRALEHRLSGRAHYHHEGCIHNLPPAEQIVLRGYTV